MKSTWRKIWHFIWEDDSILSWVVNVILAFVLIKFVVYPVLGMIFATTHPIVAVVSGSMEHDGNFDDWWNSGAICSYGSCTQSSAYSEYQITAEEFQDFTFRDGFNTGDIMILYGSSPENIKLGDVLVFQSFRPDPIIHRVIDIEKKGNEYLFQTKGDHNSQSYSTTYLNEVNIKENQVIGKAVLRIPWLGYVKIGAVKVFEFFVR